MLRRPVGGEAGSGVEVVPRFGRRAVVLAPPRLGLDVASGLLLVLRSLLSETRERGAVGWMTGGVHCVGPNRQCERVWDLARVRRGRPQNERPHYRVELLVGIRVRGRPGYPIKGACGLGRAELRSGALAPKGVSRVPRCTRCARRSSGVRGSFECPVIP